jgi:hypothetical protein
LEPVCAAPDCRRKYFLDWHRKHQAPVQQAKREQAARQRQEAEAAARRVIAAWDGSGAAADSSTLPLALIPAWEPPRVANLPERRRRAFRDNLMRLISQASVGWRDAPADGKDASAPESAAPDLQPVLNQVCAFCEGWCCRNGADHAYLTVETLRRYLAAHPGRRPRDVLANYLDRVGHRTYRGSCVYHGPTGCTLSREMRSDICNRFYCRGLSQFQHTVGPSAPPRAAVATQRDGQLRKVAILSGGALQTVPLPLAPPPDPQP